MSLRATAFGRDWKQTTEAAVDARVCDCCPTTTALTADGPIAAFRNRSEQEVRDIYVTRFERGRWTEPRAAHEDGWKIAACPVNGPMLERPRPGRRAGVVHRQGRSGAGIRRVLE